MKFFVIRDDIDQHEQGCDCGDCNSNGRSYGAGIFNVEYPDDCVERLYACNEEEAVKRAEARAKEMGELVIQEERDPDERCCDECRGNCAGIEDCDCHARDFEDECCDECRSKGPNSNCGCRKG